MRTSLAALAIIQQQATWLVQWNEKWNAYSLIGGHVESDETFRECCEREIMEELECQANSIKLSSTPYVALRFREFSESAKVETDYEWQIFNAELDQAVLQNLPSNCAWVTSTLIESGHAADDKPIASQVSRVQHAIEEKQNMKKQQPKVTWMADASLDLSGELLHRIDSELIHLFTKDGIQEIIVKQRFRGFTDEPEKKLIIAVETQSDTGSSAHVVKLGNTKEVSRDCVGWQLCAVRRGVASRIFSLQMDKHRTRRDRNPPLGRRNDSLPFAGRGSQNLAGANTANGQRLCSR